MALGTFRTMVLSFKLGHSDLSDKHIAYVMKWLDHNVPIREREKYATIAWQYDADKLSEEIKKSMQT